jgi:hypothetical protein
VSTKGNSEFSITDLEDVENRLDGGMAEKALEKVLDGLEDHDNRRTNIRKIYENSFRKNLGPVINTLQELYNENGEYEHSVVTSREIEEVADINDIPKGTFSYTMRVLSEMEAYMEEETLDVHNGNEDPIRWNLRGMKISTPVSIWNSIEKKHRTLIEEAYLERIVKKYEQKNEEYPSTKHLKERLALELGYSLTKKEFANRRAGADVEIVDTGESVRGAFYTFDG